MLMANGECQALYCTYEVVRTVVVSLPHPIPAFHCHFCILLAFRLLVSAPMKMP